MSATRVREDESCQNAITELGRTDRSILALAVQKHRAQLSRSEKSRRLFLLRPKATRERAVAQHAVLNRETSPHPYQAIQAGRRPNAMFHGGRSRAPSTMLPISIRQRLLLREAT